MRSSTTKFVLFMMFVACLIVTQVVAKHHHKHCEDDDHEDWDDDNDWNDDDHDWDNDNDNDNESNNDWDKNNGDWNSSNGTWDSGASSWPGSWPTPTYGQSTGYYPPGAPATITGTYTQVFTATGLPSRVPNQPPTGSMASATGMGVPVTLAAIMFTIIIVA
ncbi:hypothetical protein [Parasitella parasitica]|uniref:Uncharacterized protein n=1 Tax=Parasitella parasitica TaxID=35722 RepID=A0A0B7N570_9FUNG|nr:hypothetical protein [Parasitella parasitica]